MKKPKFIVSLFFSVILLVFILMPMSGCKKERWCACYCRGNFYDITYLEYLTEEECEEMSKKHDDCDCEWD